MRVRAHTRGGNHDDDDEWFACALCCTMLISRFGRLTSVLDTHVPYTLHTSSLMTCQSINKSKLIDHQPSQRITYRCSLPAIHEYRWQTLQRLEIFCSALSLCDLYGFIDIYAKWFGEGAVRRWAPGNNFPFVGYRQKPNENTRK